MAESWTFALTEPADVARAESILQGGLLQLCEAHFDVSSRAFHIMIGISEATEPRCTKAGVLWSGWCQRATMYRLELRCVNACDIVDRAQIDWVTLASLRFESPDAIVIGSDYPARITLTVERVSGLLVRTTLVFERRFWRLFNWIEFSEDRGILRA